MEDLVWVYVGRLRGTLIVTEGRASHRLWGRSVRLWPCRRLLLPLKPTIADCRVSNPWKNSPTVQAITCAFQKEFAYDPLLDMTGPWLRTDRPHLRFISTATVGFDARSDETHGFYTSSAIQKFMGNCSFIPSKFSGLNCNLPTDFFKNIYEILVLVLGRL